MFDKISLAKKLSLGFGIVLILLGIVGLISYTSLENATEGFTGYREMARDTNLAGRLQANLLMARMNAKDYIISGNDKNKQDFFTSFEETQEFVATAQADFKAPDRAKIIDEVDEQLVAYKKSFEEIVAHIDERNNLVNDVLLVVGPKIEKALTEVLISAKEDGNMTVAYGASLAMRNLLLARLYTEKFLQTNENSATERVHKEFADMKKETTILERELQNSNRRSLLAEVIEGSKTYENTFEKIVETINDRNVIIAGTFDKIGPQMASKVEEVKLSIKKVQDRLGPELQAANRKAVIQIIALASIAILLGVGIAIVITRAILRQMGGEPSMVVEVAKRVAEGDVDMDLPDRGEAETSLYAAIRHMVEKLREKIELAQQIAEGDLSRDITLASERDALGKALQGMVANLNDVMGQIQVAGEQIASGSGQVSDTSQSLSQGATEQASSLEEISASLNQLSSQTTTNAESANQASGLASVARGAAEKGSQQMQTMVTAMGEINDSAQSISKIIKVIDEIAFQTNLLALNAAVEAARAGQHGKGFAVVAEEVRNLAARSAKAAAETAELIEGSVAKTANGSSIANQTADALQEIVSGVGKVTDLISEIAAASNEQAQGVAQINQGVTQIDEVTQQNTAAAEESAAAAEELSGQSEQLRQMLQRFTLKQAQRFQHPAPVAPAAPARTQASISWAEMERKPASKTQPRINLDDAEFGKF